MSGCQRLPTGADIGYRRIVLDSNDFQHVGVILALSDNRKTVYMRSDRVQTGVATWGPLWSYGKRLEHVIDARILDEGEIDDDE
jgi:hypothetical protein